MPNKGSTTTTTN